jgi:hypothetical protein
MNVTWVQVFHPSILIAPRHVFYAPLYRLTWALEGAESWRNWYSLSWWRSFPPLTELGRFHHPAHKTPLSILLILFVQIFYSGSILFNFPCLGHLAVFRVEYTIQLYSFISFISADHDKFRSVSGQITGEYAKYYVKKCRNLILWVMTIPSQC